MIARSRLRSTTLPSPQRKSGELSGVIQQRFALVGLLISGRMLIPGNIPNICAASRLGITIREWEGAWPRTGMLLLCFGVLGIVSVF